jgi:hypothetical protein
MIEGQLLRLLTSRHMFREVEPGEHLLQRRLVHPANSTFRCLRIQPPLRSDGRWQTTQGDHRQV